MQPNHDRSIIVVDDERLLGGQLDENVSVCGKIGAGPASVDSARCTSSRRRPTARSPTPVRCTSARSTRPTNVATGACVAHVFWQAPSENRLTQAYYRTGAFAVDFSDPADPQQLGYFVADGGANYWSNKPHRGYLFATDQDHGLDILKYTGEGGAKWPATAGPAEVQRSARQGVPYVPIAGTKTAPLPAAPKAQTRKLGKFAFTARAKRVPGKGSRTLVLSFRTAAGKLAGSLKVKRAGGKKATVKVTGVAVTGRYRWTLRAGKKMLARGRTTAKQASGLSLSAGARLSARAK